MLISAPECARLCGFTVQYWRGLDAWHRCPAPPRFGRCKRWCRLEVEAWVLAGMPKREAWEKGR